MTREQESAETYILFELAGTTYGVRSRDVQHMEMVEHITPVPNAAHFVEGVVFSRGRVIPALNLRSRFGFERIAHDLRSRLIVVQAQERIVGLLVDAAREFIPIPAASIQPPHEAITGLSGQYLEGIATLANGRIVLILDLENVLKIDEIITSAPAGA